MKKKTLSEKKWILFEEKNTYYLLNDTVHNCAIKFWKIWLDCEIKRNQNSIFFDNLIKLQLAISLSYMHSTK